MRSSSFAIDSRAPANRQLHGVARSAFNSAACSVLVVLGLSCIGGCGTNSEANRSTSVVATDSTKADVVTPNTFPDDTVDAASSSGLTTASPGTELAGSSLDPESGAGSPAQPEEAGPGSEAPRETAPVELARKIPELSAAQLARWAAPEFEPRQLLMCRESAETGLISHLGHTRDGRHFITAGTKVVLWSIESAAPEHVFLELSDGHAIKSLAVSPNGKWFVAGDSEGTLRMWSISDHREVHEKQLYPTGIAQIAISPDGQDIATVTYSDEITVWTAKDLQQKSRFKAETNNLERIEYMSAELLAAAGETTTLWNVGTAALDRTLSPGRYNFTLARSPDGTRFLYGKQETLQLCDTSDPENTSLLNGRFAPNELVAFSGNGKLLVTANGSTMR